MDKVMIAQILPLITQEGLVMLQVPRLWTNEEAVKWAKEHWPGVFVLCDLLPDHTPSEKLNNGKT